MKADVACISGRECHLYVNSDARCLLIQPVDEHDLDLLDKEVDIICEQSHIPFSLVAFKVIDWQQELTPWPAPPVFGKVPFGNGANKTLTYIIENLLPELEGMGIDTSCCLLGGYSLAGLFSLWTAYQIDRFDGIVAASPSVWYPGWMDYAKENKPLAKSIYLSLGDKEEKARNQIMAQVGNAIREQYEILSGQCDRVVLEWNKGNHFVDSEKRMARGVIWTVNKE